MRYRASIFCRIAPLCAIAVIAWSGSAHAQQQSLAPTSHIDLQLFKPSADSAGLLNMNVGGTGGHLTMRGGIWIDYSNSILRTTIDGTNVQLGHVVSNRVDATAIATLSLFQRLEIGVAMPYNIFQNGLDTNLVRDVIGKQSLSSSGASDLRVMLKGGLLTETEKRPALALVVEGTFPTGQSAELRSEPSWIIAPAVAVSKRLGRYQAIVDLGYRHRNEKASIYNVSIGDQLFWRLGGVYNIPERGGPSLYSLVASLYGQTPTNDIFGLGHGNRSDLTNTMEIVLAGQRRITSSVGNFRVTVGIGTGILPGYGAPLFRGIAAFDYLNREPFDDDDHDGIVNVNDQCPGQPEDLDDFEDSDGCPELDNDGDGIEDLDDECPNEAEDKDNVDDFDGCPEVSELDSDLDGVSDEADKCPESAEDFDGYQDDDGCLDPDNDGDGLSDLNDLCPNEYEDQATSPDKDGCPPGIDAKPLAALARGQIMSEPVELTDTGVAPSSAQVLNQVALIMREHNEVISVEVQVAPTKASPVARRQAARRAKAIVDYLVARGIARNRLTSRSTDRPGPKGSEVTFMILRQLQVQGAPAASPASAPASKTPGASTSAPANKAVGAPPAPGATVAPAAGTGAPGSAGALSSPPSKAKAKTKVKPKSGTGTP